MPSSAHALESDYVRDQLVARTVDVNGKRYRSDGEYVLYWMQMVRRLRQLAPQSTPSPTLSTLRSASGSWARS